MFGWKLTRSFIIVILLRDRHKPSYSKKRKLSLQKISSTRKWSVLHRPGIARNAYRAVNALCRCFFVNNLATDFPKWDRKHPSMFMLTFIILTICGPDNSNQRLRMTFQLNWFWMVFLINEMVGLFSFANLKDPKGSAYVRASRTGTPAVVPFVLLPNHE